MLWFSVYLSSLLYTSCQAELQQGRWFDRVIIMVFENTAFTTAMSDPNFAQLAQGGRLFTNYFGTMHPSQPNYIDMVAGAHYNVVDNNVYNISIDKRSIFDQMEENGISWKTYQEQYPGNCFTGTASSNFKYVRKHNPAISFLKNQLDATRCAKIVPAPAQLDTDLNANAMPQYSFYTPDMDNDAHDTTITFGGNYLKNFLTARYLKFPAKTLLVITFDEDKQEENNRIFTLFLGDMVTRGTVDNTKHNHFSLLRTIQENWNLGRLLPTTGDNTASVMTILGDSIALTPSAPPTATAPPTSRAPTPPTNSPAPTPPTASRAPTPPTMTPAPVATSNAPTNVPTRAPTMSPVVNVTWNFIDGRVRSLGEVAVFCSGGLKASTTVFFRQIPRVKRDVAQTVDTWSASIVATASNTTIQQEADALALFLRNSNSSVVDTSSVALSNTSPGNSNSAAVGLGVGITLAVIVIIVLIIVAFILYSRKQAQIDANDFHSY